MWPSGSRFPEVGVLALVPDRWGPRWQTRHHLLARLSEYFQVAWINNPPSWRDLFKARRRSRPASELPAGGSLQIYDPGLRLPEFGRPAWLADLTWRERLRRARNLLLRRGCRQLVLYLWRPEFARALDLVRYDLSCYHIDDEYSHSPEELPLDPREAELIRRVDQVFVHSPAMMEKKGTLNPHTQFVPNGVEYQRYASPVPEPADLHGIASPRIGYSGVLKKQMNWRLLLQLSTRHPQWSFVFVGAVSPHLEHADVLAAMAARPNVHFLGAKTTPELAQYPQHFDVCLMPYQIDGYTKFIYPLKLHEYLASGTPTVGSRIPTLQSFEHVIALAESGEEWSQAIEQALSPSATSPEARAARQRVAQAHDWNILVSRIADVLARRLCGDSGGISASTFVSDLPDQNSPALIH